jgi:hypothetical protein
MIEKLFKEIGVQQNKVIDYSTFAVSFSSIPTPLNQRSQTALKQCSLALNAFS